MNIDRERLWEDAAEATEEAFHSAVQKIDARFGDGYAMKHPQLIAAFMNSRSLDYQAELIARAILKLNQTIENMDLLASPRALAETAKGAKK